MRHESGRSRSWLGGPLVSALILVACSGPSSGSVAQPTPSAITSATAGAAASSPTPAVSVAATASAAPSRPACPNPEGGKCLGVLSAGTYSTVVFHPSITYLVPDGWANYEDTPGNFLLVPPGNSLDGVNAGTSDYIGIYTDVAAAAPACDEGPADGVGRTASDIAKALGGRAGLKTTAPRAIGYGKSLNGVSIDITLAKNWSKSCSYSGGQPTVQLITGVSPSGLDHGMNRGLAMRLSLLDFEGGALAIEVDDVSGGSHLDGYDAVVSGLKFGVP